MKFKAVSIIGFASLALVLSACPAATNTNVTTNNANKPAVNNTANNSMNTAANNTAVSNTNTGSMTEGSVIKIDEAGIQVVSPKGFKMEKNGETTNLISPDDTFEVYFHVPKDGNYDKAIDEITTEVDDYIKDVKVTGDAEKGTFDGMPATMFSGTGVDKGDGTTPVNWEVIVLNAPKKPVLIVSYADKGSYEKYQKEISEIGKSIKKQ